MTLKPLDIQQQAFQTAFRGYDRAEVTEFLDLVRRDYEALVHANLELTSRLEALSGELDEARDREQGLRELLSGAPREASSDGASAVAEAEQLKKEQAEATLEQARAEAALIKREAELEASRILSEARAKVAAQLEEVAELSRNRQRLKASLRGILSACSEALDDDGSGDAAERFKVRSPDHDELPSIPPEALKAAAAAASSVELSAAG